MWTEIKLINKYNVKTNKPSSGNDCLEWQIQRKNK